jgi:hypothetical protein
MEVGAELRWLLWRAFGPAGEGLPDAGDLDSEAATEFARRFDLAARIGARTSLEVLESELGSEVAAQFREACTSAAARYLVADRVCRDVAASGRALGIGLVFLKGAALYLSGKVAPGFRNMSDVDVLAPEDGARQLQAAMVEAGCKVFEARESEHQLQFLTHRLGLGIEIHKIIPGVRLGGGSSATASELIERGLVLPAPGLEDGCYLPSDEVVLAHLLVHGIAQHGLSPQGYPMARVLADVQDIGAGSDTWEAAIRWIERDASRQEVEAVAGLARRLGAGEDPAAVVAGDDDEAALLRHLLAGVLDEGYAQSMKFRSLTAKPKDVTRARALAKTMRGALLPTRAQIDILYGPPRSELGYWGRRVWRPFDLVGRAVRYGIAWVGHRFRMRN